MAITVKIDGVDRTALIQKRTLSFKNILTRQTDTASFTLVDDVGTAEPKAGQEVEIIEDSTKRFSGIISSAQRSLINRDVDAFRVVVQDFSKLLDKRLVTRVFDTPTLAGDIIKTVITDFVKDTSITTTNVKDGPIVDFIAFNFRPALEVITAVAKLVGFDWFIDENKDIHFFPKETDVAPFEVNSTELRYTGLRIKPVASQLRNRIIVRGGVTDSATFSEEIIGDSKRTTFPISYPPIATPVVKVNGVPKTVGIKNVDDESAFNFLFDEDEKIVENGTQAVLSSSDTLRLEYKFEVPILVQVEDQASQARIAAIEDSDGIYEFIIQDRDLASQESARERGRAEIRKFGDVIIKGSFITHVSGFRSGQLLTLNLPAKGFTNELLLIQSVTTRSLGAGTLFHTVEFGSFSFALEDFLLDLFRKGRIIAARKGEKLDDLFTMSEEVTVSDAAAVLTDKTPPFTWGPAGSNDTTWNFGQWA